MSVLCVFLSLAVPIFVIRICVRGVGSKFLTVATLSLQCLQFFFVSRSIVALILPWIVGILANRSLRNVLIKRPYKPSDADFLLVLDQLSLEMSSGHALSHSLHHLNSANQLLNGWISKKFADLDVGSVEMNSHEHEIVKKLRSFTKNPHSAYENLQFLRSTLRLRAKLQKKQATLTLQARAQAVVVVALYVLVLLAQVYFNPDFVVFAQHFEGRATLLTSVFFIVAGILGITRLSRAGELHL